MFIGLGISLALTACAEFPELDSAMSDTARDAEYPVLWSIESVLAHGGAPTRLDTSSAGSLLARARALRARAERLRRTRLITEAERRRLRAAIARQGA